MPRTICQNCSFDGVDMVRAELHAAERDAANVRSEVEDALDLIEERFGAAFNAIRSSVAEAETDLKEMLEEVRQRLSV